ncbi:OPT super [Coemansia sp. RSA 1853]|nr:OPT super [Coemansia sp. RSA 1853]
MVTFGDSASNKQTMTASTWFQKWRRRLRLEMFTREEMVWITSMVAAGGSFAPAYQWIATIDIDYGQPLGQWQQLAVVLSTQLFGWSLGHMLRHIFVGRRNGIVWPDTLPLSFLIQALYSKQPPADSNDPRALAASSITVNNHFTEENSEEADSKGAQVWEEFSESQVGAATTSRTHLAVLTCVTFVYQVFISYIAPIFKSFCLLCLWAPRNKLVSLLGSGWNGAGILSLTFDWEALGTLQPLITPLWAQVQYYAGAFIMMYVLTPIGWHLNWWETQSQPIVSTNVFDTTGNVYNISLVHRMRNPEADAEQFDHYVPGMLMYKTYSPVRLTVNSALGYICSVAAITAVTVHLALWHPQWLRQAASDMAHALLRLWDPRPLFRARRHTHCADVEMHVNGRTEALGMQTPHGEQGQTRVTWDIGYIVGRIGRVLIFTLTLCVAIMSPQLNISALPGWQTLIAICWAVLMCLPIGFVEAVTGFTLPMDLLPHMLGGLFQGPGTPIETSYFHLWATVPIRVALGWPGVRSFQLAHHCCPQDTPNSREHPRRQLPWLKRGLLVGLVWGACVNHVSYTVFSRSLDERRSLPIETPDIETLTTSKLIDFTSSDPADILEEYYDNEDDVPMSPILGWHEPGEFGRLPAALSSELVVWGIVGPQSIFSVSSPYRMLFVYGALIGVFLPPLFYATHRVCRQIARSQANHGWPYRVVHSLEVAAKEIQIPLILTGMVAVPTIPANFVISGLVAAVLGQWWFRYRNKSLVDRSLYSAVLYTGTRVAIVGMFLVGQILTAKQMSLSFVSWWGNQIDNVEHCADI